MKHQAERVLVVIGATPEDRKELFDLQAGVRESTRSRREPQSSWVWRSTDAGGR